MCIDDIGSLEGLIEPAQNANELEPAALLTYDAQLSPAQIQTANLTANVAAEKAAYFVRVAGIILTNE